MVQGCRELVVRDDHRVEADVERARGGVESDAEDAGQVLELRASRLYIAAVLWPNDQ
jgi:hypothetical protein